MTKTALPLKLRGGLGPRVLGNAPVLCMESAHLQQRDAPRLYRTADALKQLSASIRCARLFLSEPGHDEEASASPRLERENFKFCIKDFDGRRVWRGMFGYEPFEAVLVDDRSRSISWRSGTLKCAFNLKLFAGLMPLSRPRRNEVRVDTRHGTRSDQSPKSEVPT